MTGFCRKGSMAAAMSVVLLSFGLGFAPAMAQNAAPEPAQPSTQAPVAQRPAEQTPTGQAPATQPAPSPVPAQTGGEAEQSPVLQQQSPAVPVQAVGEERDATLPQDLSPWGMFMAADWVVKTVMIGLALASLATWTVWIAKSLELSGARRRARKALKIIGHSATLSDAVSALDGVKGPGAIMVRAAEDEVRLSSPAVARSGGEGVKERVSSRLTRIEAKAGRNLSRGTGVLATIGSVAPFVGLFGTVWGIMNSFINISEAQTTNLAVVAPGIAEALLATAIGLVAAIPAVVIYNAFARGITGYRSLLADASAGVERLVSRDLDFSKAGVHESALHAAE
ncbi:tonB-system energizer ExbB [Brucella sp. BE17]|uniref:tonB-system energizer ExbB n=1 Tax=Brucella sp. BE17 TaxID=3142977 RepID=UPI0031BAF12B